jgi:hypothetical protein
MRQARTQIAARSNVVFPLLTFTAWSAGFLWVFLHLG